MIYPPVTSLSMWLEVNRHNRRNVQISNLSVYADLMHQYSSTVNNAAHVMCLFMISVYSKIINEIYD